jgi:hypothetical protein
MSDTAAATPLTPDASVIGDARHVRWGLASLGLAGALFFAGYLTAGPFAGASRSTSVAWATAM